MIGVLKHKILQKVKQKRFLRKSSALSVSDSVEEEDVNSIEDILNKNPDDPINFNPQVKQKIKNVFKELKKDDNMDEVVKAFQLDMANSNNFNIPVLIKDEEDQDKCYEILLENIQIIRTFYRHCQHGSDKYPQVSWDRLFWHFDNTNKYSNPSLKKNQKLSRSNIEIAFIAATKGDETKGPKSGLQRRELLEFIMRMSQTWMQSAYGSSRQTSKYL